MAAAITYKEGRSSLANYIDDLTEILTGWGLGKTNRTIILRAILACMGDDIYSTKWDRSEKDKDFYDKLDKGIDSVKNAIEQAAKFLHEQLGVKHDRLLPYAQQLVVLAAFLWL